MELLLKPVTKAGILFLFLKKKNNTIKIEISEIIVDLTKKSSKIIQNDKFGNKLEEKYFDSNGQLVYTIKINYEYY